MTQCVEADHERVNPRAEKQFQAAQGGEQTGPVDALVAKLPYLKLLRVTAFVKRFINNCKVKTHEKTQGPLMTEELQASEKFWITQAQSSERLQSDERLEKDGEGVLRLVGRVVNYNPIFLP